MLALAQPGVTNKEFLRVDSLSRTIRYEKDIYKLTKDLTGPYADQRSQVRAIFIWITDNIAYDYKFLNKGKELKGPECKSSANCERIFRDWETDYIKNILNKKEAICDGYARLFKKMTDIAGIKTEIIAGYTKTKPYQVGIAGPVNHAWNAVWLDSTYFLLDATWASGYCIENEETGKIESFQKAYNDYYWLTSFNDLARNHYPKDGKWVFEANYTKEKFAANPYYAGNILGKIHLVSPVSGIITAKKGDTVHFGFNYREDIRWLQVNSNISRSPPVWKWENVTKHQKVVMPDTLALKKQQVVSFKRNGDKYEFDYVVTDNALYYLELLFDYRMVMRFKVKVDQARR